MRRITAAIAIGSALGALGLGGLAYASTTGPSSTVSPKLAVGRSAGVLRRAIYAQVIVEGKGGVTHTFTLERGTFTGISSGDIHLTRPDGVLVSAPITSATSFRGIAEASLVPGDRVRIIERDGTTTRVASRAPKAVSASVAASS